MGSGIYAYVNLQEQTLLFEEKIAGIYISLGFIMKTSKTLQRGLLSDNFPSCFS